jgi:hypothetical protein
MARQKGHSRKPSSNAKRRQIMIFAEGESTEPTYFTHWHRRYRERILVKIAPHEYTSTTTNVIVRCPVPGRARRTRRRRRRGSALSVFRLYAMRSSHLTRRCRPTSLNGIVPASRRRLAVQVPFAVAAPIRAARRSAPALVPRGRDGINEVSRADPTLPVGRGRRVRSGVLRSSVGRTCPAAPPSR